MRGEESGGRKEEGGGGLSIALSWGWGDVSGGLGKPRFTGSLLADE